MLIKNLSTTVFVVFTILCISIDIASGMHKRKIVLSKYLNVSGDLNLTRQYIKVAAKERNPSAKSTITTINISVLINNKTTISNVLNNNLIKLIIFSNEYFSYARIKPFNVDVKKVMRRFAPEKTNSFLPKTICSNENELL